MTTTPTTEAELEAALSRARTEREEREQAQTRRLLDAQRAWDLDVLHRHRDLDAQLEATGREADERFRAAIVAGDFTAGLAAWIEHRATRRARYHLRSAAEGAEALQATGASVLPPSDRLMYDTRTFMDDVNDLLDTAVAQRSADLYEATLSERPTMLADLEG